MSMTLFSWHCVQSNAENLFETQLQRSILPSHTYSTSYGGDPLCIPDLTVQCRSLSL